MSAPLIPPIIGRIFRWSTGSKRGRAAVRSMRALSSSRISRCSSASGSATSEVVQAPGRYQGGVHGVGAAGGRDDEDARGLGHAVEALTERGHQPRTRLARLRRRQQVLEGQRLGLVEEEDGLALAHGDAEDLLEQIARVRGELRGEGEELDVVEDR